MAPMMQQPLPMPPSMQNIDIFQPSMPMQMAMGGSVPRNTQIAGQPHMLSYIAPGEAGVLRAMGGAGRPGRAVFRHFSLILMRAAPLVAAETTLIAKALALVALMM